MTQPASLSAPIPPDDPETRPRVRMRPNKSPQRVRFGYPWVFADELVLDRRARKIAPGTIVTVTEHGGAPLGSAGFNPDSRIAARMLSRDAALPIDADFLHARLQAAIVLRERLYGEPFYRLVHAEGDGLPGLIVDRFGDSAVIQPNAAWADRMVEPLARALQAVTGVTNVVMNGSGRARALEGLAEDTRLLAGQADAPCEVPMNDATYIADLTGGQKTGLYFDQRDNHAFAARLARGQSVLDAFSHVGGFSLAALAAGAKEALALDASAAALALAERGAETSGVAAQFTSLRGDAFDSMAALAGEGREFGLVVCDPPAFAPSREALASGLRAYERVAKLGAALVAPGGFLCLCSCSHAADLARFHQVSVRGIGRAGRRGQLIRSGGAGPDHPMHPMLAESGYLKALFFRLD